MFLKFFSGLAIALCLLLSSVSVIDSPSLRMEDCIVSVNEKEGGSNESRRTIWLKKNKLLEEQIVIPNTVYIVRHKHNLNGATISVPSGCILNFRGGEFANGTLTGEINVAGNYSKALNVLCLGDIITKDFEVYHYSPEVDKSKIEHCLSGMVICEDLHFPSEKKRKPFCLSVKSNIRGKWNKVMISFGENYGTGLDIKSDNITVSNISIQKEIPNQWNNRYALNLAGSNIVVRNCNIFGAIKFTSRSPEEISSTVLFENNTLIADFSPITWRKERYDIEKDAIVVHSVDDITFKNNNLIFINVNRGFKLSSDSYKEHNKSVFYHYSRNITINNNTIKAYTTDGEKSKQLIDCYIGSRDVVFSNNTADISNFSVIFENKTHSVPFSDRSVNYIRGNMIDCDCRLCYINTTDKDSFVIDNNEVRIRDSEYPFTEDGDVFFNGRAFCSCPTFSSLNIANNHVSYIGNQSSLYFLVINSRLRERESDVTINNNALEGMAAIVVSNVESLTYANNEIRNARSEYELGLSGISNIAIEKNSFDAFDQPKHIVCFQAGDQSGELIINLPEDVSEEYDVILNPSRVSSLKSNRSLAIKRNVVHVIRD